MIPYIVLNGKTSTTVTGLLISELPTISKPKQRTEVKNIDGRDGDIVTPLGFSAYDKTLKIGLRGQYNVDDIISYFNSSGKVIFSNEPDKYYNYAIYDSIDFEKLIRFKTAKVKLHVQPFKYSADEKEKTFTYPAGTTTATITVRNNGNYFSKPKLTITGAGNIQVYLGDTQIFLLTLDSQGESIIIDIDKMNAYDMDGNYLNRLVTGDYNDFTLKAGLNDITVNGSITSIAIDNYSRWI